MEPTNTTPTETPNVPPMPPELPTLAPEAPAIVIEAPTTEAPITEAPATEAPLTLGATEAPTAEAPLAFGTTEAPTADSIDLPTIPPELLSMPEQALSDPMASGTTNTASAGATAPATGAVDFSAENPIGAMDPITMPSPTKAPNPEEEELKAPFKAAEPVPGSIGSAISVPSATGAIGAAQGLQTPSVAFNDPAMQQGQSTNKPAKKKMSKTTLILLAVLGVVVIVVLIIVLINMLGSGR